MARSIPNFSIRTHDPAKQRRAWIVLLLVWIGWSLLVAAIASALSSEARKDASPTLLVAAEKQNDELKARIALLARSQQIAEAALADVQQTLRDRDEQIAGLRADLAFYGRLAGGGKGEGLAVHALRLERLKDSNAWNFIATLTQNFKRSEEIKGRLTVVVEGVEDGKLKTLDWSALNQGQDANGVAYAFKYFQQVKGTVMLEPGLVPNKIIVRVDGDGAKGDGARVEQDFAWSDATKTGENGNVQQ